MTRPFVGLAVGVQLLAFNTISRAQPSSSGMSLVLAERTHAGRINAFAVDASGYIWAVGTADAGMPASPDALTTAAPGGGDAFLERIAPDGSLSYLTYIGGTGSDVAYGVTLDAAGNIYVTGTTSSRDFPTTGGAFDRSCGVDGTCRNNTPADTASYDDGFVLKLAPGGRSIVYSTYVGGRKFDFPKGIAVDAGGRAHVAGMTTSPEFPLTSGAVRTTLSGIPSQDAFYLRLSADGSRLEYSTYLGGSAMDDATGVAVDASGVAYVTGWTGSWDFTLKNAIDSTFAETDAFLARFSAGGLDFSTFVGGSSSDNAYGVAVSSTAVYVAGSGVSSDFPGAPRACGASCSAAAFVVKVRPDGGAFLGTTLLDGSAQETATSVSVDARDVVFVTGFTESRDFPASVDAAQISSGNPTDAFFAVIPMTGAAAGAPAYATYLGGASSDWGYAVLADGAGGAWVGGTSVSADFPRVDPKQTADGQAYIAHVASTGAPAPSSSDIVLYARDAARIAGNWQVVSDTTAAGGARISNPDAGAPKAGTASPNPTSSFELTFDAEGGVPYHLWLRMKAANDSWANDSVFVQFSDAVDAAGNRIWQTDTSGAAVVSLEDCTGCGEHGWGWNDNGYGQPAQLVTFATTGTHTLRIQQREDGISIDQVVLSSRTYINDAPGTAKDDATILSSDAGAPPAPSPADAPEIVMHVAAEALPGGQNWLATADSTAAGGARLANPDREAAKAASVTAAYPDYFEVQFTAQANTAYHLWLRGKAQNDWYTNDSVFVQFSDSADADGNPVFRSGTSSATTVVLEDCGGCGNAGWGWQDNAYAAVAPPIYFSRTGPQTIRVTRREDGVSIDQIVLSPRKYLDEAPGLMKNDATIVPKER